MERQDMYDVVSKGKVIKTLPSRERALEWSSRWNAWGLGRGHSIVTHASQPKVGKRPVKSPSLTR